MDLFAPTHLLVLLLVILVIFGPSRLGDVGGALGKGIRDFKRAINEPESIVGPAPSAVDAATARKSDLSTVSTARCAPDGLTAHNSNG
jgi:sec-independent protein translocase protein TatA